MKPRPSRRTSNDICVDASLWVRWLTPEEGSEEAKKLFLLWLDSFDYFLAPSLLVFEVYSTLRKKVKLGKIDLQQVHTVMDRFARLPILLYQSLDFFQQAWSWSEKLEETVLYDASYLALAAWQKVPFYTTDGKFYEKAKRFYPDSHLV